MKYLALTYSLILFSLSSSFAVTKETLELSKKMIASLQRAKDCIVKEEKGVIHFCTGFDLTKKDMNFLTGLDRKSCESFLSQNGFEVVNLGEGEIKHKFAKRGSFQKVVKDFEKSTKVALIDYEHQAVFFKKDSGRGDCLHEVIHFYQRHRKNLDPLSPQQRILSENLLQKQLESEVTLVEKVEKEGNKEKAAQMASDLQPIISLQREWGRLRDWLDEKEVYQFMFDYASKLKLTEKDIDIAISNLVKYREALPWRLEKKVLARASEILTQKYRETPTPKTIKHHRSEKVYATQFQNGEISREEFEEKVIGKRKYKALKFSERATNVYEQMKDLASGRFFEEAKPVTAKWQGEGISYHEENELPTVTLKVRGKSFPMVLDLGAQDSILPASFINSVYKKGDVTLVDHKILQTTVGVPEQAPIIQINEDITFDKLTVKGLRFAVTKIEQFEKFGVLGMDFFNTVAGDRAWQWNLEKSILSLTDKVKGPVFTLSDNGLGEYDSIEYRCPKDKDIKIRLDTGSQVLGDYYAGTKEGSECFQHSGLHKMKEGSVLFDRDVDVNLGYPYLKKYYRGFQFHESELSFQKK